MLRIEGKIWSENFFLSGTVVDTTTELLGSVVIIIMPG